MAHMEGLELGQFFTPNSSYELLYVKKKIKNHIVFAAQVHFKAVVGKTYSFDKVYQHWPPIVKKPMSGL